jgi:hypothetical protein
LSLANQKFGEKILESLQEKFEKLILETEPDSLSEIAERRLRFYERNESINRYS